MTTGTGNAVVRGLGGDGIADRVGRQASFAGVLIALGVGLEWVLDPQQRDGTVVRPAFFAVCVVATTIGFALLASAAHALRRVASEHSKTVRVGSVMSTVGAGLLVAFAVTVLGTGLATGSPAVWSFIAFGLGMLLLSFGPVVLGLGLRRRLPGAWMLLVLAGVAAFAAIAIPLDPWHDVSLMAMCAAWTGVGVLLRR